MNSAAAAVNPPSLDLRFVQGVPVLTLDESADIERLRASIRTHLPGHLPVIAGRASRLDLGAREITLFDLRRIIHLLKQEYGVEITGLYVRGGAIHRFAERELKLKLFPTDPVPVREAVAAPAPVVEVEEVLEELVTEELDLEGEEPAPAVFVPAPIDTRVEGRPGPRVEVPSGPRVEPTPIATLPPPSPLDRTTLPHDLTAAELLFGEPEPPSPPAVEPPRRPVVEPAPEPPAPRLVEGPRTQSIHRTLRSGAIIRFEGDLYVFGDVNPGAQIIATGNIVVLGALKGVAHAGANGDESAFILAFDLRPTQLRIGRKIAVPAEKRATGPAASEIATVLDDQIVIDPYRSTSAPGPGRPALTSGSARRTPGDPTRMRF